jgi:hypothetical protein
MEPTPSLEALRAELAPLIDILRGVDVGDPKAAQAALQRAAPLEGALLQRVRALVDAGAEAGWLLPKENGGVRFGRVAKDLGGFSVDAVHMAGPGPEHVHPNGEIDLCFAHAGTPTFDGQPEGWVVLPPRSRHVPTVRGGEMRILYFLPGGAIEFTKS